MTRCGRRTPLRPWADRDDQIKNMHTAIIGLGKIGKNICLHLLEQGVSVVAYNRSRDDVDEVVERGAVGAYTLGELSTQLAVGRSQKVEDSGQLASPGQGGLAVGSGQNDKTSLQLSAISDQTEMTSPPPSPNRRGDRALNFKAKLQAHTISIAITLHRGKVDI